MQQALIAHPARAPQRPSPSTQGTGTDCACGWCSKLSTTLMHATAAADDYKTQSSALKQGKQAGCVQHTNNGQQRAQHARRAGSRKTQSQSQSTPQGAKPQVCHCLSTHLHSAQLSMPVCLWKQSTPTHQSRDPQRSCVAWQPRAGCQPSPTHRTLVQHTHRHAAPVRFDLVESHKCASGTSAGKAGCWLLPHPDRPHPSLSTCVRNHSPQTCHPRFPFNVQVT